MIYYFCFENDKKMKNLYIQILLGLLVFLGLESCNDRKTYGELVDEEEEAIERYILEKNIKVISKEEFFANDSTTRENEYVFFKDKGIYMNIVNPGEADEILQEGSHVVLSRFIEVLMKDVKDLDRSAGDTLLRNMYANDYPVMQMKPEEYKVMIDKQSGYAGTFQGTSIMAKTYEGNTAVPTGWLFPLQFIKPTRTNETARLARVKLILPHSEGSFFASRFVYPCYYEITYNLGK